MLSRLVFFVIIIGICFSACQQNNRQNQVIAFYNLENLFDTINTPNVNDEEFTPEGSKQWNSERYKSKLQNMSKVIADLGKDEGINGPSILGLCEMENRQVLEDLINTTQLKNYNYKIIHSDSPDKRGIDVALLYKPNSFTVNKTQLFPLIIQEEDTGKRIFTRDQLLVSGLLNGDKIHLIVNHWPSRYGGKERSISLRKKAAMLNRHIIDSLLNENKNAKIFTMGDFNDDPTDESISTHLNAHAKRNRLSNNQLYDPLANYFNKGEGSLYYRGKWNLFDQIIISQELINKETKGYQYDTAFIYNKPYLIQQDGKYKGNLLRTHGGKNYLNGYSDHLPVYMILKMSTNQKSH